MKKSYYAFVPLCLSLASHSVLAAAWEEKFYNPKPLEEDVILPMPCDGKMVFRMVHTGTRKPLEDKSILLGNDSSSDGFVEHTVPNYISGGFVDSKKERYYLIAKYEVSQLQYQSVMDAQCPTPNLKGRLPATNLSWFDAINFTNKYNEWLMKNAAQTMPKEDNISGYLRLPTNSEWEFAARGGIKVSDSAFREPVFPLKDKDLSKYAWFASSKSANGRLQLTGLLEPNPLGLFDMLGNAKEIMLDPFRMNKLDRYHGQYGGVTVRGGSYLDKETTLTTSLKIERPFYSTEGTADKAKDMGFRVVINSPVLTSANRLKELNQEWAQLGRDNNKDDAHGGGADVVGQLEALSANVENEKIKKDLQAVNNQLRAANQAREEQRDYAIQANLQLGSFLCSNMADLDERYKNNLQLVENLKPLCESGEQDGLCSPEQINQREQALTQSKEVRDFVLDYYANTIVGTQSNYSEDSIKKQVDNPITNRVKANLVKFTQVYWKHLQQYYKDGKVSREQWLTDCFNEK